MDIQQTVIPARPEDLRNAVIYEKDTGSLGAVDVNVAIPKGAKNIILFCYGGTPSFHRWRSLLLLQRLFAAGHGVAFFDYRGISAHGPNEAYEYTGLHTRLEDAQCALVYLACEYPQLKQILWGHSMGGYIAACLSCEPLVSKIILSAPAAYASVLVEDAVPFGETFKKILHEPGRWMETDAFEKIKMANIPLLLFTFQDDVVVPSYITESYFRFAASEKEHVTLPGTHHGSFNTSPQAEERRYEMTEAAAHWIDNA
jgi:alpha-beta hydrolase superfamily lysophospholipase